MEIKHVDDGENKQGNHNTDLENKYHIKLYLPGSTRWALFMKVINCYLFQTFIFKSLNSSPLSSPYPWENNLCIQTILFSNKKGT
jgi:hypothetical protein